MDKCVTSFFQLLIFVFKVSFVHPFCNFILCNFWYILQLCSLVFHAIMQFKIPSIEKLFFIFIHYTTIFPKISSIVNVDWPKLPCQWLAKVGLWMFLKQIRLTSWVIHMFTWGMGQSFLHKEMIGPSCHEQSYGWTLFKAT